MGSRLNLHEEFIDILGSRTEEDKRVYYNPPSTLRMKYRCIRYSRQGIDQKYASNAAYKSTNRYEITVIDYDPESDIPEKILARFPMCKFDRQYVMDNLYHFVLTLYY